MFGYLVAGRAVQTVMQQVAPDKFLFNIEDAANVHNIAVFLTDLQRTFPAQYGAAVYLAYEPFTEWKYLGHLSATKPSAFFRIVQSDAQIAMSEDGGNGNKTVVAQIGISIEPLEAVLERQKVNAPTDSLMFKTIDFRMFAFKMCKNFVNYMLSFSGSTPNVPANLVPTASVDRWYQNFQKKLQNDVLFWKDQ
eukprot:gene6167-7140_t